MSQFPPKIENIHQLEDVLSTPSKEFIDLISKVNGDLLILGAAGKIGPSLARMTKRACDAAGVKKRIVGVSRYGSCSDKKTLEAWGIETIQGDLLNKEFLCELPQIENVVFMAGRKFGSTENLPLIWAVNSYLPALVAEQFKNSRIVIFSTGCVYPLVSVLSGGSTEKDAPEPVGEYSQSCLGRERMFEYGSRKYQTPIVIIRLNYAVELRYGVLVDIALKVKNRKPIDLTMGFANVIWQGDVNDMALRSFEFCESPAKIINLTGPEIVSIRLVAERFAELFKVTSELVREESETALLSNASLSFGLLGKPKVTLDQMILWTVDWIEKNRFLLNKPTHFEARDGKF